MEELLAPIFAGTSLALGLIGMVSVNAEIRKAQENPDDNFYLSNASPFLIILLPYFRFAGKIVNLFFHIFKVLPSVLQYPWKIYEAAVKFTTLKIIVAGKRNSIQPDEVFGMMLFLGAMGLGFGLFTYKTLEILSFAVIFPMVGFFLPYLWLMEAARKRQKTITRQLPFAMDLMTLTVEAGLDFSVALQRIINEMGRGPLADEFTELLREIRLGSSRKEALRSLAERVQVTSLRSVCSALIQADEVGASLVPILKILSETLRQQRSSRAEEMAGKAPVKMLAPLILCIFPCVFIVIFGPIFIKTVLKGG